MNPKSDGSGGGPTDASGSPVRRLPYLAALDGLRTLALLAVLLDHGGVAVARGGHLGVTVFFVLSGFLVTALLLQERHAHGRIDLRAFWARRARRLVPASLLCFALTLAYLVLSDDAPPSTLVGDGVASLTWTANWRFVLDERSYGDLFADPTPFAHLWSLAIEEQFYLGLPVLAALVLGRRGAGARLRLGVVIAGVAAAATAWMWTQYDPATDPLRLYYGTDTRIAELAVGALCAVLLVRNGKLAELRPGAQWATGLGSALAVTGIAVAITRYDADDGFNYRGGLLLIATLAAVVVVASTQPRSLATRVLAVEPLPQLGRLSYGAYLFHWPLFLWLDADATGLAGGQLLVVRITATFGLAFLSHELLEQPIRLGAVPRPVGGLAWANVSVALVAVLVVVAGTVSPPSGASVFASQAGPISSPVAPPPPSPPAVRRSETPGATPDRARSTSPAAKFAGSPRPVPDAAGPGGAAPRPAASARPEPSATTTTAVTPTSPNALRIAVVGDSLGGNLATGLALVARHRTDLVVHDLSLAGCPVSRGGTRRYPDGPAFAVGEHCGWWERPADDRTESLRSFDPHIVLVEDAFNELIDRKLPGWRDFRAPGDPRFDAWLLNEYRSAADVFSANGAAVVYANAPCADWQRLPHWASIDDVDERVEALNRTYDGVVAATSTVADLYGRICPEGQFRAEVEGVSKGRPDGFHLSDEAARRLAERWLEPILRSVDTSRREPL